MKNKRFKLVLYSLMVVTIVTFWSLIVKEYELTTTCVAILGGIITLYFGGETVRPSGQVGWMGKGKSVTASDLGYEED